MWDNKTYGGTLTYIFLIFCYKCRIFHKNFKIKQLYPRGIASDPLLKIPAVGEWKKKNEIRMRKYYKVISKCVWVIPERDTWMCVCQLCVCSCVPMYSMKTKAGTAQIAAVLLCTVLFCWYQLWVWGNSLRNHLKLALSRSGNSGLHSSLRFMCDMWSVSRPFETRS